ncbi:latent-transforming growth factor beta-binding protein 2 isoform X2 [Paramormyrops kingsleyae]|uniref:latent-transforming growth factor beta-binding protein 2 isoform X2 n=1 Tax=Paramormyrops kingsleyae TaxID=1676925 RepID=UPI003B973D2F
MNRLWVLAFIASAFLQIQTSDSQREPTGDRQEDTGARVLRDRPGFHNNGRAQTKGGSWPPDESPHRTQGGDLRSGPGSPQNSAAVRQGHRPAVMGDSAAATRETDAPVSRSVPKPRTASVSSRQGSRIAARQSPAEVGDGAPPPRRLTGANVCGGQHCCSGWAVAPGTNRCIKPDCQPPCQNRGSCSRPHTCVCRSGFQGRRCEEVAPEQVYVRSGNSRTLRPIQPGAAAQSPRRHAANSGSGSKTPATKQPPPTATLARRGPADTSSQQTGTSRTVKRYPSSTGPITSNALPSTNGNGQPPGRHRAPTADRATETLNNAVVPAGANLTSSLDRIKIVFTPMVCRRICSANGRCHNSCEKGDTTTVYSENQSQPPKNQGFRLYFCQIPCMNGGRCIGRDQCWCPSNSTGKFCHLPASPPAKPPSPRKQAGQAGHSSSMYTLPLSNQQASMQPSLVNVHIQHPPDAEVQVHQVARVKPGQVEVEAGTGGTHSVQQRSQPGNGHGNSISGSNNNGVILSYGDGNGNGDIYSHTRLHNRLNGYVGRCFQETVDGKCGKPLPGLTRQEDCCGSVGASWGLNKCTECPPKPAYAVIAHGQVECPKGYKRMNLTHCQDINECTMAGICKNAECLNTKGSYRCTCKGGYMLDAARSHCVSDKAVSEMRDLCYRSAALDSCSLPLSQHITKQICCCSRVGKAWGAACELCPLPDTDHFKEICPAGHGYTYSRSDIQISLRQMEEDDLHRTGPSHQPRPHPPRYHHPHPPHQHLHPTTDVHIQAKLPGREDGDVAILNPAATVTESPSYPDVVEKTTLHSLVNVRPETEGRDTAPINVATQVTDVDRCSITPTICGPGQCVPVQTGYTCYCHPGYQLNPLQTRCIDVDECKNDPCEGKGRCVNSYGSYICHCYTGYSQVITQNRKFCQDVNECDMPDRCPGGRCVNTEGSYACECDTGYALSRRGQCEDVDECRNPSACPSGKCINTPGSFQCQDCGAGFRAAGGRCLDINECLSPGVCVHGRCVNKDGSYECICNVGFVAGLESKSCRDKDECLLPEICPQGSCINLEGSYRCSCDLGYQPSPDGKACQDIDECATRSVCPAGICKNTQGSYQCTHCGPGFTPSADGLVCEDIDECLTDVCPNGICLNSEGWYSCISCPSGYTVSADRTVCEDVDECQVPGTCPAGICVNIEGSYSCEGCADGYAVSADGHSCDDVDECAEEDMCPRGQCLNTDGSFQCVCSAGFVFSVATLDCQDIDECANYTACGAHGFCENSQGSYRCYCDRGYIESPGIPGCIDTNECEMGVAPCGEALCENVEGSFLCICSSDNEEFDPVTTKCRDRSLITGGFAPGLGETDDIGPPRNPVKVLPPSTPEAADEGDQKECYYNINDDMICSNVLSRNTTKQECCCTVGEGWGDNCEIHPCPIRGRAEYSELCLHGFGLIPPRSSAQSLSQQPFEDADECEMFGQEICKKGHCSNTYGSYSCFCQTGYYYDTVRLECVDHNECETENVCVDGMCINMEGSFACFCSPPLVLDGSRRRCVAINTTEEGYDPDDYENMVEICWESLTDGNVCALPILDRHTTYAECCCLFGVAWGNQCALCPTRTSDDYAVLCNLPRRGPGDSDSLRERPGYEYGPDGLERPESPIYWGGYGPVGGSSYFNSLGPEYGPQEPPGGPPYGRQVSPEDYSPRELMRVPVHRPRPLERYNERYEGFEGLRAEECGILNGCENGRCVRVREGYTCDCFDGYHLDLSKMACVDINECEDISDNVPLCQNAVCSNTEGSYKCTCLPGFVATPRPHECIPEAGEPAGREAGK